MRAHFYGESAPVRDLITFISYTNCCWCIIIDFWGEKKIYFACVGWSPSILASEKKDRKNPFTEANLAKLRSFCTAPRFKYVVVDNQLLYLILVYMFGSIFGKHFYISILRKEDSYLLEIIKGICSIKSSWGVTGFYHVFLTVCQVVGRKIQPTGYKTKCTHRRASFRPQEGLTDQNRPQNHPNDRIHRTFGYSDCTVPVGYFPCCCKPLVVDITIN